MATVIQNPRDFDRCAYQSKSGKTKCYALRWYHDDPTMKKRHSFVEAEREVTPHEALINAAQAVSNVYTWRLNAEGAEAMKSAITALRAALAIAKRVK